MSLELIIYRSALSTGCIHLEVSALLIDEPLIPLASISDELVSSRDKCEASGASAHPSDSS